MMLLVAIAVCGPGLIVLVARPRAAVARRLARLFRAQQEWAEQMDRRAEQSQPNPLPYPARKALERVEGAAPVA